MTSLTKEARVPLGRQAPRRRALEELLRPRPHLAGCTPARSSRPLEWIDEQVRRTSPRSRDANLAAFQAGHAFGETAELFDHPYEVAARPSCRAGDLHQHHRQHRRWPGASSPPASWPSCRCSSARYPITPASDILHELSKHKNFGVRTLQAEDEIAGIGAALGAAFGGHLGVTTTSGPGRGAQGRDDRPGRQPRAAAADRRHPARRARRPACPPRPSRPTCCMAMYGRHGEAPLPIVAARSPGALLRRRHRGGPHRAQVPHAGHPAVRRLPRQRHRAVAAARRRRRCRDISVPFATEPNHIDDDGDAGVLALPARPRDARPPVGASRARPGLMHRIGGIEKEDGTGNITYDPGQPRADGRTCGPTKVAGIADDIPRRRGRRRRRRRRACSCSAGAPPGAPSTARSSRARRAGPQGGARPPHPPQPVPGQPRRGPAPLPARCSCPS